MSGSFNLSDFTDDKYNDSLDSNIDGNRGEPNATLLKSKLNELEEKLNLYKLHHEIIYDADVNTELNGTTPYSIKNSTSKHNPNSVITKEGSNLSMSRASLDTNYNQMWYLAETRSNTDMGKLIKSYNGKSCLSGEEDNSITMKKCDDADVKQKWVGVYTENINKREYTIYSGTGTGTEQKCITNHESQDDEGNVSATNIKLSSDTAVCGNASSKWLIYPSDLPLLKEEITELAREANELIKIIIPKGDGYKAAMDMNVTRLLTKNTELQEQHVKLLEKLKEPMKLDENFELTKITTTSNFSYYMLYLIFTIFIVGCLIYVFKNPEESNLDMFILALAGMIFAYYVYDYYKNRKRN